MYRITRALYVRSIFFNALTDGGTSFSNKITALGRREPKDAVDILFLCRKYEFEWEQVFREAMQKVTFIDPLDVSLMLSEFPKEFFSSIRWAADFSFDEGANDLQVIARDILHKKNNSLAER